MTDSSTLEQRIRRLEDLEAIQHVTVRYADAINKDWNRRNPDLDALATIFAPDARWHSHDHGTTVGAEAIAAALPAATAQIEFSMHTFLNPRISIDGDTATGSWLMWIASVMGNDPRSVYMSADMTYTRRASGWRIQTIDVHPGIRVPALPSGYRTK